MVQITKRVLSVFIVAILSLSAGITFITSGVIIFQKRSKAAPFTIANNVPVPSDPSYHIEPISDKPLITGDGQIDDLVMLQLINKLGLANADNSTIKNMADFAPLAGANVSSSAKLHGATFAVKLFATKNIFTPEVNKLTETWFMPVFFRPSTGNNGYVTLFALEPYRTSVFNSSTNTPNSSTAQKDDSGNAVSSSLHGKNYSTSGNYISSILRHNVLSDFNILNGIHGAGFARNLTHCFLPSIYMNFSYFQNANFQTQPDAIGSTNYVFGNTAASSQGTSFYTETTNQLERVVGNGMSGNTPHPDWYEKSTVAYTPAGNMYDDYMFIPSFYEAVYTKPEEGPFTNFMTRSGLWGLNRHDLTVLENISITADTSNWYRSGCYDPSNSANSARYAFMNKGNNNGTSYGKYGTDSVLGVRPAFNLHVSRTMRDVAMQINNLTSDLATMTGLRDGLQTQLNTKISELATMTAARDTLQTQYNTKVTELTSMTALRDGLQTQLNTANAEITRLTAIETTYNSIKTEHAKWKQDIADGKLVDPTPHLNRIQELLDEIDELTRTKNAVIAGLEADKLQMASDHANAISLLNTNHAAAIAELESNHADAIAQLESNHAAEIAELESNHAAEIAELESNHADAIAKLESDHDTALAELEADYLQQLKDLEDDLTADHTDEIQKLKDDHDEAIQKLKDDHDDAIQKLSDDYDDAIQDLLAAHSDAIKDLMDAHSDAIKDLMDAHKDELDELEADYLEQLGKKDAEILRVEGERDDWKTKHDNLKEQLENATDGMYTEEELLEKLVELEESIMDEMQGKIDKIADDKTALDNKIKDLEDNKIPSLNNQISNLGTQVSNLDKQIKDKNKEISEKDAEIARLVSEITASKNTPEPSKTTPIMLMSFGGACIFLFLTTCLFGYLWLHKRKASEEEFVL